MIPENLVPPPLLSAVSSAFAATDFKATMVDIDYVIDPGQHSEHLQTWLNADELRRWSAFKLNKRKSEWLAGRICAKMALAGLLEKNLDCTMRTYSIDNREDGRPYVASNHRQKRKVHISISHSGQRAAALASPHRCGIDVQHRSDRLFRVRERFCLLDELQLLQQDRCDGDDDIDLLNLLWAAKEAIRKAYSYRHVPGFLSLMLDRVEKGHHCYILTFTHRHISFTTLACRHGDYGLALCFLSPDIS